MAPMSASERVRARLKQIADARGRGFRTFVRKRLGVAPSTVTPWLDGTSAPSLDQLERLCKVAKVRMAELFVEEGSVLKELDADEAAILRAVRSWPRSVVVSFRVFLAYFAMEDSAVQLTRKHHATFASLDDRQRDAVHSLAVTLSAKVLAPDRVEALLERSQAEWQQLRDELAKRRRKDDATA